jgi:acyl homoserine lactone synthase
MIEVITPDIAFVYRHKLDSMFQLRHRVFKERLDWDVNSRNGRERDVYDLMRPIYLLATDDAGEVRGTWRLLPTTGPNMLRDVFPELMDDQPLPEHPQVWETSRFAVEPGPDGCDRRLTVNALTGELFAGLVEWALTFGIQEVVTVYDVRVGRLLNRIGVRPLWVSQRRRIGNTLTVAGRFEISDAVLDSIKSACDIDHSVLVDREALEMPAAAEVQHAAA